MMVRDNIEPEQLDRIVAQTMTEADRDKDGKISLEEFRKVGAPLSLSVDLRDNPPRSPQPMIRSHLAGPGKDQPGRALDHSLLRLAPHPSAESQILHRIDIKLQYDA